MAVYCEGQVLIKKPEREDEYIWKRVEEKEIFSSNNFTYKTTGGTTASFAMLGDINIAEPGALIGFAGPRVVKDTTGQDLPEGFQTSEFVLEHGFLDFITHRKDLKKKVNLYLDLVLNRTISK